MSYRILLLSAYDAVSHRIWRERLEDMFPEHAWTQLALPARHFNWRIRGNSLQWALNEKETLMREYDLLIATSMVDLASLRGFVPHLCKLPTLLYFHENQFAYPAGGDQRSGNIEPQLVPLYSAFCADAIAFNSHYNRSTFLRGAESLLEKLPDSLDSALLKKIGQAEVAPVPLEEFTESDRTAESGEFLEIVWNHRWEYDKGPALLLKIVEQIGERNLPLRLHIVGQQFRTHPREFELIRSLLDRHADSLNFKRAKFGYIKDRGEYVELLRRCDVVLSTALHDFQGLAVQEACSLGCTPLVPNSLVYPEYLEESFLYDIKQSDRVSCEAILSTLLDWRELKRNVQPLPRTDLAQFSQATLKPRYAEIFQRLLKG